LIWDLHQMRSEPIQPTCGYTEWTTPNLP